MRTATAVFCLVLAVSATAVIYPNRPDAYPDAERPSFENVAGGETSGVQTPGHESVRTHSDTTVIPFDFVHHIFIQAEIDGHPADLLLDPIQNVILDRSFATQVALPLIGGRDAGYGSDVTMGGAGSQQHIVLFARNIHLRFGGMARTLPLSPTVPLDSMMADALGRHVDGLIGINLLSDNVVEIDFSNEQLLLHPSDFEPVDAVSIPISFMERRPTIPLQFLIAGKVHEIQCLLDFGMGGTLRFTTRYTEEADLIQRLASTVEIDSETGMGGRLQSHLARVDQLELAEFTLDQVVATLARERQGADADRPWDALIGLGLLSRFRVYLDVSRERIFLRPGERFDMPFEHVETGIRFVPHTSGLNEELVIQAVDESSTAAAAGLHVGDVILLVDGESASGWNRRDWGEALDRRRGENVELVVRRNAQRVHVYLSIDGLI